MPRLTPGRSLLFTALLFLACTHSDPFVTPTSTVGPFGTGSDVQLTLNVDQNYWPAWTQDGRGVLYSYVDLERPLHRCLGLLPAAGGTRLWQLCDDRAIRDDSTNSFAAYALDSAGRLLAAEAVSWSNLIGSGFPHSFTLWLADTATPYVRTALLTLPQTVGNTPVTWLSDIAWTGPNTFIALGQQLGLAGDSVYADSGGVVLRGTITANHATLQAVTGTEGATGYSLAQGGTAIVFTAKHYLQLFTVPAGGGVPNPPRPARDDTLTHQKGELLGVSCKGVTCIVAKDGVLLTGTYWAYFPLVQPPGWNTTSKFGGFLSGQPMELHKVSLTDGADQLLRSDSANIVFVTPQVSPASGDVVLQVGGGWGHLQTFSGHGTGALHLYKGVVP